MSCVAPRGAFYAMPKVELPQGQDRRRLSCSACCASKGILCVYGSGFGTAPEDGFFRIVFLATPKELGAIYDDVAAFTARVPWRLTTSRADRPAIARALHRGRRGAAVGDVPGPQRAAADLHQRAVCHRPGAARPHDRAPELVAGRQAAPAAAGGHSSDLRHRASACSRRWRRPSCRRWWSRASSCGTTCRSGSTCCSRSWCEWGLVLAGHVVHGPAASRRRPAAAMPSPRCSSRSGASSAACSASSPSCCSRSTCWSTAQGVFDLFVRLFPPAQRKRVCRGERAVAVKISAWLGGQILLGFIIGTTSAIGLCHDGRAVLLRAGGDCRASAR